MCAGYNDFIYKKQIYFLLFYYYFKPILKPYNQL